MENEWAKLLKDKGISMRELAKRSGVKYKIVKKICCGEALKHGKDTSFAGYFVYAAWIAKALGVRVKDLPNHSIEGNI